MARIGECVEGKIRIRVEDERLAVNSNFEI